MGNKMSDRSAKRQRFAPAKPAQKKGADLRSRAILLVAALAVIAVGIGAALTMRRPQVAGAVTEGGGAAPLAATHGHDPYPQVMAENGVVRLPAADFADGQARHYTYMDGEQPIEFFVVQSADGLIRAAFNACDVCYLAKRGYRQQGDTMVCVNCGLAFPTDRINEEKGGCNPAPLRREMAEDGGAQVVVIAVADILEGARFF